MIVQVVAAFSVLTIGVILGFVMGRNYAPVIRNMMVWYLVVGLIGFVFAYLAQMFTLVWLVFVGIGAVGLGISWGVVWKSRERGDPW